MSTTIEWTQRPGTKGETWNPTTGCNKVSQGCKHCYAQVMHRRLQAMGVKGYEHDFLDGARPQPHTLDRPLKWKKPRTVFVNSMSDLFHEAVPFSFILEVYAEASITPRHTYLVLTKRPERAAEFYEWLRVYVNAHDMGGFNGWFNGGMPNVWLGTSVEDQAAANSRIPHLLRCPAAVRFLSCEPLLGPVELGTWLDIGPSEARFSYSPGVFSQIDWVIAGGESGHGARHMHPDWARSLRDQCRTAGVPFFMKQMDKKEAIPYDLYIRQFPDGTR